MTELLLARRQCYPQADVEQCHDAASDRAEHTGEYAYKIGWKFAVGGDASADAAQDIVLFGFEAEFVGCNQQQSEDDEEDD